jgi:hypothetical protein
MVGADSPPGEKVAFFAELFAARRDVYYVDVGVPVLAASVGKRARGYLSLGFPDPRGAAGRRS